MANSVGIRYERRKEWERWNKAGMSRCIDGLAWVSYKHKKAGPKAGLVFDTLLDVVELDVVENVLGFLHLGQVGLNVEVR